MSIKIMSLCFMCLSFGALYYALGHEWIIIRTPSKSYEIEVQKQQNPSYKKSIDVIFYRNAIRTVEKIDLLWSDDPAKNVHSLVASWLVVLDEEEVTPKKVSLQSAWVTPDGELFLSFDRTPLYKEWSTYEKLLLIQGLLHMIRENDNHIKKVYFLVHHQPMQDTHLDFTDAWPISGFIGKHER